MHGPKNIQISPSVFLTAMYSIVAYRSISWPIVLWPMCSMEAYGGLQFLKQKTKKIKKKTKTKTKLKTITKTKMKKKKKKKRK